MLRKTYIVVHKTTGTLVHWWNNIFRRKFQEQKNADLLL